MRISPKRLTEGLLQRHGLEICGSIISAPVVNWFSPTRREFERAAMVRARACLGAAA